MIDVEEEKVCGHVGSQQQLDEEEVVVAAMNSTLAVA
jgi:hypothetical protein